MTKVALIHEPGDPETMRFRAVAGCGQAMGRTAGEALDALARQLPEGEADTMVIVRSLRPDRFFTAEQQQRLEQLMERWRESRRAKMPLSPGEQAELEGLVEAEVKAAADRAAALRRELEA